LEKVRMELKAIERKKMKMNLGDNQREKRNLSQMVTYYL